MKKTLVIFAIGLASINMSFASKPPILTKEIKEKVTFGSYADEIDNYNQTFLVVNFNILKGKIKINNIKGSGSQNLKRHIITKLTHLSIESNYDNTKEYTYKFIFKK